MQYPVCVRTSIDSTILKSQVLYFKVEKLESQKRQEAHFAERYPQDPTRTCKSGSSSCQKFHHMEGWMQVLGGFYVIPKVPR